MTAPRLDLGELRRLHEAATPGPWERATTYGGDYCTVKGPVWTVAQIIYDDDRRPCTSEDDDGHAVSDTALIAAMRNALPALLSIAEAAEAFMSEEHDCDDDQPCLYHDALSAALAAVRKEEKGD